MSDLPINPRELILQHNQRFQDQQLLKSLRSSGRYQHKIELLKSDLSASAPTATISSPKRKRSRPDVLASFDAPFSIDQPFLSSSFKPIEDDDDSFWSSRLSNEASIWLNQQDAFIPMFRDDL